MQSCLLARLAGIGLFAGRDEHHRRTRRSDCRRTADEPLALTGIVIPAAATRRGVFTDCDPITFSKKHWISPASCAILNLD